MAVVFPKSKKDIVKTVKFAGRNNLSIIPRGAGTGTTGGCLGSGLVLDFSKYMNQILEINLEEKYAICEPGVVLEQLNQMLAPHGFRFGPDTSTENRATLGGMLANNASGSHSARFGKMVDNILETELILASGEVVHLGTVDDTFFNQERNKENSNFRSNIQNFLKELSNELAGEINDRYPKIDRRVSGYNLDELIHKNQVNLAKIIAGSEGTLGIVSQLKIKIVPKPATTGVSVLFFDNIIDALNVLDPILKHNPYAVELIDNGIV